MTSLSMNSDIGYSVTFTINDPALYQRLLGFTDPEVLYTVRYTLDGDPGSRITHGLVPLLIKMRDLVVYEFRRAAGLSVAETLVVTIPDVRLVS